MAKGTKPGKQPAAPDLLTEARAVVAKVFEGSLPTDEGLVMAACEKQGGEEDLESLLSFRVYPTKVAIVISTGQKYEYGLAELVQLLAQKVGGGGSKAGAASE
jgi:hypothetical protein